WEEPCISGTDGRGTGAVFFSGCTLKCAFCQNMRISREGWGKEISVRRLADIFRSLEDEGAHSLDLVTGTQFIPSILNALDLAKPSIPVVWNSGGYEKAETLKLLDGYVQVYLPDLKHVSARLSRLCAGAEDYFQNAGEALLEMRRQVGENVVDEDGILQRGMLVRHLILPGCTTDSIAVLSFLHETLPDVPVSVMRQYMPVSWCHIRGLDRKITDREYERVLSAAQALGVKGYMQGKESAVESFVPSFDGEGIDD
ncbi:MAG: radical SAM protein, partial [Clostridia bacterium]|nr:radical SAM protein [Clostridia bacterium]